MFFAKCGADQVLNELAITPVEQRTWVSSCEVPRSLQRVVDTIIRSVQCAGDGDNIVLVRETEMFSKPRFGDFSWQNSNGKIAEPHRQIRIQVYATLPEHHKPERLATMNFDHQSRSFSQPLGLCSAPSPLARFCNGWGREVVVGNELLRHL